MKVIFWFFLIFSYPIFGNIQTKLTLITFQDAFHLFPDTKGRGGLAQTMTLLEEERKRCKNSFTVLNGGFLSPLYFSEFDQAKHMIDLLNQMKIDGILFQDPCFEYGYLKCMNRKDESMFRWLGSNLINAKNRRIGDPSPFILEVDHVRIGIFALSQLNLSEEVSKDVYCVDPFMTMKRALREFYQQNADVIVVYSNMTRKQNLQLVQMYPEIDVVISSGGNTPLGWYENETFFYETGKNHSHLEMIDLICEKKILPQEVRVKIFPCWRIVKNQKVQAHAAISKRVEDYKNQYCAYLHKKIQFLLQQYSEKRKVNTTFLLSQALREYYHTDFILFSSDISIKDLVNCRVTVLSMKGSEILHSLENHTFYKGQRIKNIDPFQSYRVIIVSKSKQSSFTKIGEIFKNYLEKNKRELIRKKFSS